MPAVEPTKPQPKNEVTPGVLDVGCIYCKQGFLMDRNRNGMQDGERENSAFVCSWKMAVMSLTVKAKYDFYGDKPRSNWIAAPCRVNAEMVLLGNRNAGDAGSRFVDLKRGELAPC